MNLPNKLTLSRLFLTLAFLFVIFLDPNPWRDTVALFLFSAASITDYFDGMIARRDKLITNFGILMDPLADKILVCSAFIAFVGHGWIPAWMVVVVVSRELAITGLRLLAASQNVVLAAERFGKHKTISQMVAILALLILQGYRHWGNFGEVVVGWTIAGQPWIVWFTDLAVWAAIILTFTSGSIYLWRNRQLYLKDL
ncbi:MAG: CDP-diacylglycerol--glycerol-3-phosphate 3-phosphatidyltransferase [Limisphaerales bacterium]